MVIKSAEFITSATGVEACPQSLLPEFAFIGRSNVGKSSLINMLTAKKGLAKVSDPPGKTQLINYYKINNAWFLVDLPGYGYAKVAKHQQSSFNASVAEYLEDREQLRLIFLLIDSRHEPQGIDLEFLEWLEAKSLNYAIVFTKTDKQSPTATRKNIEAFKEAISVYRSELPPLLSSSAEKGLGRGEILQVIEDYVRHG